MRITECDRAVLLRWLYAGLVIVVGCGLTPRPVSAEIPPLVEAAGRPIVRNYDHRDFGAEVQNWDVLQGANGLVYFANNAGVLEFDGRTWRVIELPSHVSVRSLARDREGGRIYVGAMGDFGFLEPDAAGQLQFTSLLPPEARRDRAFNQIIDPVVTPSGIYFNLKKSVCRWLRDRLRCREAQAPLSGIFAAGDNAYVQQGKSGLLQIVDSSVRLVPGGELFADEDITFVLSYPVGQGERLLVGTRQFGLFLHDGKSFRPFGRDLRDPRREDQLLGAVVLGDRSLALATRLRGVLVVDEHGRLQQQIDRAAGLIANHVHALWADQQGGLWAALQFGIGRVELGSPFSIFNEGSGLEPEWRDITRHQGVLYVRGYKGLFASQEPPDGTDATRAAAPLRFTRVADLEAPVWSFEAVGERLLVSSRDGVHEIRDGRTRRIATYTSTPMTLYAMHSDPGRVYVGLAEGLASLALVDGTWRDEGRVEGIDETITSIAEGHSGDLWLVARGQRIIRLGAADERAAGMAGRPARVLRFEPETLKGRVSVRRLAGGAVFLAEDGIHEFEESTQRFVPVAALASLARAGRRSFSSIAEDPHGNLWVASRKPGNVDILWKQPDGHYVADNAGLRQIPVWSIYPDPQGSLVWFCAPDYLLRYDPSIRTDTSRFATLVRRVTTEDDVTIFGGVAPDAGHDGTLLASRLNSLRFDFAAPRFDAAERNEFQSYLEGFDHGWSAWSRESSRTYTNLPQGRYRFRARSRDVRGELGEEAVYTFTILPPWYQTSWAYLLYASLLCGCLVTVWQLHVRRARLKLERDREHLELEKLRELDRMKSRFFADVSHEFRTPISLILGPIGQMLQEGPSRQDAGRLRLVRRNAQYLLRLISQFLDLSKLEARKMPLRIVGGDLMDDVAGVVAGFTELSVSREVRLSFRRCTPAGADWTGRCFYDRDVLEKILNNLLGNAFKFTPRGGAISVEARRVADGSGMADGERIEMVVSDTGPGIAPEHAPYVFDRFYQVDGTRSREGFGVGLALVKELVELHRGTVAVESEPGKGTRVIVRLAVGADQFRPDEIAHPGPPEQPTLEELQPALLSGRSETTALTVDSGSRDADAQTTILVVEDHADLRSFLREQLESRYRVVEAGDGAEGLERAASLLPGLVLSDVMMGEMNGFELCRALKTSDRTSHIPVVLLTARAASEDRLLGLNTGADCYVVKPFDPPELLARIRNLIDQRRLLRERFSASVVLKPSEMAVAPADQAFLSRVLAVVESNLDNLDFDIEHLGRAIGLSRSQLHRKVRALTNQPPTMLIRSIRLQRAAELLAQRAGSVAEIAYSVGFSSQAYFAKCFREQFHTSPREYRDSRGNAVRPDTLAPVDSIHMRRN